MKKIYYYTVLIVVSLQMVLLIAQNLEYKMPDETDWGVVETGYVFKNSTLYKIRR